MGIKVCNGPIQLRNYFWHNGEVRDEFSLLREQVFEKGVFLVSMVECVCAVFASSRTYIKITTGLWNIHNWKSSEIG